MRLMKTPQLVFAVFCAVTASFAFQTPHAAMRQQVAATHDTRPSKALGFPPTRLEEHRSEWTKALSDISPDIPTGSDEVKAWILGAWWAITDWCTDQGRKCEEDAAVYVKKVLGNDPRSIKNCEWVGAIGGDLGAGYDITSEILHGAKRKPVMLDDLFERHTVKQCPKSAEQ